MHFAKPSWVCHQDTGQKGDQTKPLSIFSIHVHPDGSRIATGGLDAKVRIWSTKPILSAASELSGKPPKSLCTLSMHTGPVLTVRWAHSGRWLASGSDDEIVMIWDLDPNARGKVWGSDEVNVEGWKPMKRLPGHESDVTDVAWSPGDRYLASVGLDSAVIVWCGYTLERLRKLEQHHGFVKGVCWDPVGEFLATQSDDKSVKVWRTTDWSLEAEVMKPFEDSPSNTFFRRLSWSPDGAHITASNATNNKGMVFIAAVITRNTWTSEISLVGHENTVEVASYNPHIFLREPDRPVATSNICSVVALGGDDCSVSVWQTKSARPLIVAKEVFERQIMDLSWSWDGLTLYAASSDGTIAAFHFEPDELDGIAPHSAQEQYLTKFNFIPPPLPAAYSHFIAQTPQPPQSSNPAPSQLSSDFGGANINGSEGGERVNKLVAKRRKPPTQHSQIPSAGQPPPPQVNGTNTGGPRRAQLVSHSGSDTNVLMPVHSSARPRSPPLQLLNSTTSSSTSFFPYTSEQPFGEPSSRWGRDMMDVDVPIDSIGGSDKGKRRETLDNSSRPIKARTLGGDRPRDVVAVRTIDSEPIQGWSQSAVLPAPSVLNFLSVPVDGSDDILEGRNAENAGGVNEVAYVGGKSNQPTQWLDYVQSPVICLVATTKFCAAATQDGAVHVYSHTGRRIMQPMVLGAPCSVLDGSKNALMAITVTGHCHSWDLKNQRAFFPPTSVASILAGPSTHKITSAAVRSNGCPLINCSNGTAFSYNPDLLSWVKLSDRWWAEGSDAWQGRQRSGSQSNRQVMSWLETSISEASPDLQESAGKQRPEWWSQAMTLGHLETKLHSARLLDSPQEYKQVLLVYAKRIADEGFRSKAEELIRELFGPVYSRPSRDADWSPTVIGLGKRDLLKDVLSIFARSKSLAKLAMDWQDTLKRASNEE